jgi:hypothetical protein
VEKILCSGGSDDVSRLTKRLDESERGKEGWNKTKWEAEWLESLSRDVDMVRRTREPAVTEKTVAMAPSTLQNKKRSKCISDDGPRVPQRQQQRHSASYASAANPTFDPLHLPSLIAFSVSLLGPLKARLGESMRETWLVLNETKVRVALLGGFCLGIGVCLFTGR